MLVINSYVDDLNNLYTIANAANPIETNATTGTDNDSGNTTWYSRVSGTGTGNPSAQSGQYFLENVHDGPDDTTREPKIPLTGLVSGDVVKVTFSIRTDNGGTGSSSCRFAYLEDLDGWADTMSVGTSGFYQSWGEVTLYGRADAADPELMLQYTSCAKTNMVYQIDNLRVERIPDGSGGANLFDGANAADPENEVNGTSNTGNSSNATTISSVTTGSPTNGTYALEIVHANGTNAIGTRYLNIMSTFAPNSFYHIKFDAKVTSGGEVWTIRYDTNEGWASDETQAFNTVGDWITVESLKKTSATAPGLWRFRIQTDATADAGNTVLIDNVRVWKVT